MSNDAMIYNPVTGAFIHPEQGKIIGSSSKNGYLTCHFHKKMYTLHRLAFLFMTGTLPTSDVDHINGDRTDNRWENLRLVTRKQNGQNRKQSEGLPLPKNIDYRKGLTKPYRVKLKEDGKAKHIGYYPTLEDAVAAATDARNKMFGEYARHF